MELKDRLRAARNRAKLTQKDIERNIPNLKQSTYSELERGLSKSTSRIVELATLFGVSVEWLANGEGEMVPSKASLGDYTFVGEQHDKPPSKDEYISIPQYDVRASCGNGALIGDVTVKGGIVFKKQWLDSIGAKPKNLATIYAQGDSMSPTIQDGQVLLVDISEIVPQSSKIYIICIDNQLYIKRLINVFDGWIMRSDNPDKNTYPDIKLSPERMESIDIQGRVMWQAGLL